MKDNPFYVREDGRDLKKAVLSLSLASTEMWSLAATGKSLGDFLVRVKKAALLWYQEEIHQEERAVPENFTQKFVGQGNALAVAINMYSEAMRQRKQLISDIRLGGGALVAQMMLRPQSLRPNAPSLTSSEIVQLVTIEIEDTNHEVKRAMTAVFSASCALLPPDSPLRSEAQANLDKLKTLGRLDVK